VAVRILGRVEVGVIGGAGVEDGNAVEETPELLEANVEVVGMSTLQDKHSLTRLNHTCRQIPSHWPHRREPFQSRD